MKKLLNSMYITNEKAYLSLENENIIISAEGEKLAQVPFVNIENIVCFNYLGCSPALMGKCVENGVPLNFLRPNGRFLACVTGPIKGNVVLRQKQFDAVRNCEVCLKCSKSTIIAKLHNTRVFLSKFLKNHKDNKRVENIIEVITQNIEGLFECSGIENIRGIEGGTARLYFGVFSELIMQEGFTFNGRSKRPPLDNVNALLSFFYSILTMEVKSALETVGLDSYVGFMHTDRPGRPALALDLVEELRVFFVDSFVVRIINLNQVKKEDFIEKEGGAVIMTDDCRKKILKLWEEVQKESIKHPIINEKIQIGLIPYIQAQLFAKYLRGDVEEYTPFVWG